MSVKWKEREKGSWKTLLSSYEKFTRELNKPYSYGILWAFVYKKNFDIILGMINGVKNCRILDIGCGGGWLVEWMAEAGGFPAGVDISPDFLKISKVRVKKRKFVADFVCADGEHLPFRDNVFDYTVTYQSLHHFPCPETVILEALRVSRSLVLADEPATFPLPRSALKLFKEFIFARMQVGEASGIEEVRFDPKELELTYLSEGYRVNFKRVWSCVPAIFTGLEKLRVIREIYKIGYLFLMNAGPLRNFGHGFIMNIQKGE